MVLTREVNLLHGTSLYLFVSIIIENWLLLTGQKCFGRSRKKVSPEKDSLDVLTTTSLDMTYDDKNFPHENGNTSYSGKLRPLSRQILDNSEGLSQGDPEKIYSWKEVALILDRCFMYRGSRNCTWNSWFHFEIHLLKYNVDLLQIDLIYIDIMLSNEIARYNQRLAINAFLSRPFTCVIIW